MNECPIEDLLSRRRGATGEALCSSGEYCSIFAREAMSEGGGQPLGVKVEVRRVAMIS